jgi:hypothetical protein
MAINGLAGLGLVSRTYATQVKNPDSPAMVRARVTDDLMLEGGVEGGLFARAARRMLQFPPRPRLVETASDKAWRRETLPGLLTAPQAAGQ